MKENAKNILFFDGVCHLCNGVVDFSLPRFKPNEIFYAPLQGPTAKSMLPPQDLGLDYVVYFRHGIIHRRSQAVVFLLKDMGGIFAFLSVMLRIFPQTIADYFYAIVAKYRYKVFGKNEVCRIPTSEERKYFLD